MALFERTQVLRDGPDALLFGNERGAVLPGNMPVELVK